MTTLVLDTNAWLDLLHFEDPRCAALRHALDHGEARVAMRTDCRDEWLRVLAYPALALDASRQQQLIARFDHWSVLTPAPQPCAASAPGADPQPLPRCADADDQKFLELARDARATALLTRDAALLRLSRRMQRIGLCPVLAPEDWPPRD
jgi:uncharacterized protein